MSIRSLSAFIMTVLLLPVMTLAQTNDQFIVNQFIGTDDAPTIPGNVTATPQSTSAISIAWDASIDDTGLAGYEIYRDLALLATVTAPTTHYTDTGLSASTSYAYQVRAFDTGYQFSAFSTSTATSTYALATTTPTPVVPQTGGGAGQLESVLSFTIGATPGVDAIALDIDASRPVRATIAWAGMGGTMLGTPAIPNLALAHQTTIPGLQSGATYRITVTVTDEAGEKVSRTIVVGTLRGTDTVGPANPSNFDAIPTPLGIRLTWDNPTDRDFESVRIMRLNGSIPLDPYDGTPIYEGPLEGYFDSDVGEGGIYGYTIFAKDESGNFSSGVVTIARAWSDDTVGDVTLQLEGPEAVLTDGMTITQADTITEIEDGTFIITNDDPFLIQVPADRFPRVLKTILVSLAHPDGTSKRFTFLLRANKDRTAYEARIDPLTELGRYAATIAFLDADARVVTKDDFTIEVTEGGYTENARQHDERTVAWGTGLLALIVSLIIALTIRRMWLLGARARTRGGDHTEGY